MTDNLKAPERVWAFDRYVNGVLMAEGVTITRASSFEEACVKATKLASRGPHDEAPVLVLAHRDDDRIATLEAALADMTQQRDEAMAGAVKVKPLVFSPWRSGGCMGCPQPFQFFITQMQDQNGDFLCHWDSSTYKTLDEAKAHAQACYLPPDPDRMLALTAAAEPVCYLPTKTVEWLDTYDGPACAKMTAVHNRPIKTDGGVPVYRIPANALAALSRIEAQAEARGMRKAAEHFADNALGRTITSIHRGILALADATEAAAKGGM